MAVQDKFDNEKIRGEVRKHYGNMASRLDGAGSASCCSPSTDTTPLIYDIPEVGELPLEVRSLSAGCGDPITLAELQPGQTVLDLGSGGGIDCFLAAQKVGPEGHVIGVDMTPEMLTKARANKERMGMENVDFRLGEIEHIPVADESSSSRSPSGSAFWWEVRSERHRRRWAFTRAIAGGCGFVGWLRCWSDGSSRISQGT
jgi:SAM-dependent methyltransferase